MSDNRFKSSIFYIDSSGEKRFLFKLINYGNETDELKFIFSHPDSTDAVIHSGDEEKYPDEAIIRQYGELSYHSDGSLLWKLPQTKSGQQRIIHNPHETGSRRTPLNELDEWEPVVIGNIIRYSNCRTGLTEDAELLPENEVIFNGEPFEYYLYLGHMKYKNPPNAGNDEIIYRVNNVAKNLDMILWITKSDYKGTVHKFGDRVVINDNNRIRVAEPKLQFDNSGAVEIELKILRKVSWNPSVVNDDMRLNLQALSNLPPQTLIGKAYLRDNPYLNQLMELVGLSRGFAISPFFNKEKINIRLMGILDKDDDGEFLSIGTLPD